MLSVVMWRVLIVNVEMQGGESLNGFGLRRKTLLPLDFAQTKLWVSVTHNRQCPTSAVKISSVDFERKLPIALRSESRSQVEGRTDRQS